MNIEKNDRPQITKLEFFQLCGRLPSRLRKFALVSRVAIRTASTKHKKMTVFGPNHFGWVKISPNSFAASMHHAKMNKHVISDDLCV